MLIRRDLGFCSGRKKYFGISSISHEGTPLTVLIKSQLLVTGFILSLEDSQVSERL